MRLKKNNAEKLKNVFAKKRSQLSRATGFNMNDLI